MISFPWLIDFLKLFSYFLFSLSLPLPKFEEASLFPDSEEIYFFAFNTSLSHTLPQISE